MKVTRTVVETKVSVTGVLVENGKAEIVEENMFSILGTTPAKEKEINARMKEYQGKNVIYKITNIEYSEKVIGMDLEKFIKLGEEIKRPASQIKKEDK